MLAGVLLVNNFEAATKRVYSSTYGDQDARAMLTFTSNECLAMTFPYRTQGSLAAANSAVTQSAYGRSASLGRFNQPSLC